MNDFPALARVDFHLRFKDAGRLPAYLGSALRGALGHSLKRLVCVTRQPHCDGCLLQANCFHFRFFETPARRPARNHPPPHPWVLEFNRETPQRVGPGEQMQFTLLLLDFAIENLAYLTLAIERAGEAGLGREALGFELQAVEAETPLGSGRRRPLYGAGDRAMRRLAPAAWRVPARPDAIRLQFLTPLRLKQYGDLVGPREFTPGLLLDAVHRRIREFLLAYGRQPDRVFPERHAPGPLPGAFTRQWLRWRDWTRYSSRQQTRMQLGGLVGEAQLDGRQLGEEGWRRLWLGQWLHAGKQSSMGLGQYRIVGPRKPAVADRPSRQG